MLSQRTLFWYLSFHYYYSSGCFSSIHNVNDPHCVEWIFLCGQKEDGLDHRKGLGPISSYWQYCCAAPPCESDL